MITIPYDVLCICPYFIYVFWWRWVFVAAWAFPREASRGYSPVAVCGILTAAASLVVEHRLQGT